MAPLDKLPAVGPLSSLLEERGFGARPPMQAGIGLRAQHHARIASERPDVGWLEAHSENYFASGGPHRQYIRRIREHYPLSLHGVGLSLGSTDPLNRDHLRRLMSLVEELQPVLVSEHLAWSSVEGRFTNDLLPLPYTEEALRHLALRIQLVQDALGRQILIENVSSYLRFSLSQMAEWDFLAALACESDCGILLDVNNVYVSATNHGFDPARYLAALPRHAVKEMHLAGHSVSRIGNQRILVDTHDGVVAPAVWELYALACRRFRAVPTLIEWDARIPSVEVLVEEARRADQIRGLQHAAAA